MNPNLFSRAILPLAFFSVLSAASAAVITPAGNIEGMQVTDWRTSTVPKGGFDIDGDDIFGSTLGAINFGNETEGQTTAGSGVFGFSFISSASGMFNGNTSNYPLIDDLAGTGTQKPGIVFGDTVTATAVFGLEGTAADYLGQTVRVGIMADTLSPGENAEDRNKTYQLTQTSGVGSGDSGIVSLRSGGPGNFDPEMYFFDIVGVLPGDQFTLTAARNGDGGNVYISPVAFDIVPEPTSVALGLMSGAGLLAMFRRRRS